MNRFIKIAGLAVVASALVGASFAFAQDASSTTQTTTPTHNQQIQTPPDLQIGPKGAFLAHGVVVQSVNGSSFTGTIWGVTYTVNVTITSSSPSSSSPTARPEFLLRGGNSGGAFDASQVQVGDQMGVSGWVASSSPLVVNAQVVRDYSISVPRPQPMDNASGTPEGGPGREMPYNQGNFQNSSGTMMQNGNGYGGNKGGAPENQSGTPPIAGTSTNSIVNRLNDLLKQLQGLQNIFKGSQGQ